MAVQPDTTSGTLTTTAGSINFTTSGTNLLTREHLPGDRFLVNGLELQIATITGENTGTLTEVCPPSAAVSGYPVRLRFQPDGARVAAQTRNLIDLIGNGTIQSLAELDGQADELIGFLGPNTLRTFSRSDLIQGADFDVQVDTLADRAAYDNRPTNYSVLVSDIGDGRSAIYVKRSDTDGDWSAPAYITGPVGPIASIQAGTTTTVTPENPANVTVVPNGIGGYTLNFSIPQGFQGVPGVDGAQGPQGNGLQIDEVGPLSERSNYDNQPEGFTFFDTDGGNLYFRVGAAGNWSDPIAFQGPPGISGAIITTTNGVGNGTVGPYALNAAPINSESVWVSISGVQQYDYVISGTNITFGIQVPSGVPWQVKTSGPLPVGVVGDNSVGADQIDGTQAEAIRGKIGAGDVKGPSSSVNERIAVYDGDTGKLLKDSGLSISDVSSVSNSVRTDRNQNLSSTQSGVARANIEVDLLGGFRNKFINGDMEIWQRGLSQNSSGYRSVDRWNIFGGGTWNFSRVLNAANAFLNAPRYNGFLNVTAAAPSNDPPVIQQRIEEVRQFSGKKITIRARMFSTQNITVTVSPFLVYGTGGSPFDTVTAKTQTLTANSWSEIILVFDLPSITGKTVSEVDSCLQVQFRFPHSSTYGVYMTHFSLTEGDNSLEKDSFSTRHIGLELDLCRRYYEERKGRRYLPAVIWNTTGGIIVRDVFSTPKRVNPSIVLSNSETAYDSIWTPRTASGPVVSINEVAWTISYGGGTVAYDAIIASTDWTADAEL